VSEPVVDHRELAISYFNRTWTMIDADARTAEQDREMVASAFASRQHWAEAGGTSENLAIAEWQVAHTASLAGYPDLALAFARAAVNRSESAGLALWLQASAHEGLARAHAAAGDRAGFDREAQRTRQLLADVVDAENQGLIASQLASIPPPE
jgi:hypothetical protein